MVPLSGNQARCELSRAVTRPKRPGGPSGHALGVQAVPTANDVVPLLGGALVTNDEVTELIRRATGLVRTYTRGAGFDAEGSLLEVELASVIVASVARVLLNPECALALSGPRLTGTPGTFGEWTLGELEVLARYRHRQPSD